MAFCTVDFLGKSIGKFNGMHVILPDGEGPFPVLYLLHGLSDDHTIWLRRTRIETYVQGLPLIVVMPNAQRSFYVNDPRFGYYGAFEDHIVKDVVGFTDTTFPTIRGRQGRFLAGMSMGGYGALMLALRHPDVFSAACSHAGALSFAHTPRTERPDIQALADSLPPGEYDLYKLAEKLKSSGQSLRMRLDCGASDVLLQESRAFHQHLAALGLHHMFEEPPGEHSMDYANQQVGQMLEFFMPSVSGVRPAV